jgi:hypothetical protein
VTTTRKSLVVVDAIVFAVVDASAPRVSSRAAACVPTTRAAATTRLTTSELLGM